jgi:hypothetical protein
VFQSILLLLLQVVKDRPWYNGDSARGDPMSEKIVQQECPCCQAMLTIDLETGAILMHKETKKAPVLDIFEAARSLKDEAGKREESFRKNMEAERQKESLLKKKFEEALKRAKESPDEPPPLRDIDID